MLVTCVSTGSRERFLPYEEREDCGAEPWMACATVQDVPGEYDWHFRRSYCICDEELFQPHCDGPNAHNCMYHEQDDIWYSYRQFCGYGWHCGMAADGGAPEATCVRDSDAGPP